MAFETEYSNIIKNTDMISAGISPALVARVVAVPLILSAEDLPQNTNQKLARKQGSLVAEVLGEGTAYTPSANSEITQASVQCVVQKTVVVSELTDEVMRFTPITPQAVTDMMAQAIARDLDDDILALFTGFSQSQPASSVCTVDDIMDAAYQVEDEEAERPGLPLFALLDKKQVLEIRKELIKSAAGALANANLISLLTGMTQLNGYAGSLPGVEVFSRTTIEDANKKVGLVFNPEMAFFAMYDSGPDFVAIPRRAEGFYLEVSSKMWNKCVEWNDVAGCQVRSAA